MSVRGMGRVRFWLKSSYLIQPRSRIKFESHIPFWAVHIQHPRGRNSQMGSRWCRHIHATNSTLSPTRRGRTSMLAVFVDSKRAHTCGVLCIWLLADGVYPRRTSTGSCRVSGGSAAVSTDHSAATTLRLELLQRLRFEGEDLPGHELLRGGEAAVASPVRDDGEDSDNRLERLEACRLGHRLERGEDCLLHLRVRAQLFSLARDTQSRGGLLELRGLALRDTDRTVEGIVSVAADAARVHVDKGRGVVGGVHPLERHILAALKLDEILLAVDDLERAARREHADVASVEPALFIEISLCKLGHLVITAGDVAAAQPDLASAAARLARGVHGVGREVGRVVGVSDLGLRVKRDLDAAQWRARDADAHVVGHLDGCAGARLGEAVALHQRAVERGAAPFLHLGRDGASAREHDLEIAAGELLELLEQNLEERRVAVL
mmetsp:Transcript_2918/g.6117  ORF Transcript_2918/g.6117 Transcript_2918/m.6117 type:complete len:436 (-) Transcript_2918:1453-2760(-)